MSLTWRIKEERGSRVLIDVMYWIVFSLGRSAARVVLYFIIGYYFLFAKAKRKYSSQFLQKALKRKVTLLDIYKHFLYFGSTLLDRFYLMSNKSNQLSIEVINEEYVLEHFNNNAGCILLGSHLGSFDLLRCLAQQNKDLKLKIVMDKEAAQYVDQRLYGSNSAGIINSSDLDCVFKIESALQQGDLVGMLGDRVVNQQRVVGCSFLGLNADFSTGPMLLATLAKVPVVLFFGLYLGGNRYKIIFEKFDVNYSASREQRQVNIDMHVKKYVERLEYYAKSYPYNWFNFYEYWKND